MSSGLLTSFSSTGVEDVPDPGAGAAVDEVPVDGRGWQPPDPFAWYPVEQLVHVDPSEHVSQFGLEELHVEHEVPERKNPVEQAVHTEELEQV